jgi:hypothetical protein
LNEDDVIWNGSAAATPLPIEAAPHRTQEENARRPMCRNAGMRSSPIYVKAAHFGAANLEQLIKR